MSKLSDVKAYGKYRRKRDKNGKLVYLHRWVWEQEHKRKVPKNCMIHHINGNRSDCRIQNLALMKISTHTDMHNNDGYYNTWRKNPKNTCTRGVKRKRK